MAGPLGQKVRPISGCLVLLSIKNAQSQVTALPRLLAWPVGLAAAVGFAEVARWFQHPYMVIFWHPTVLRYPIDRHLWNVFIAATVLPYREANAWKLFPERKPAPTGRN